MIDVILINAPIVLYTDTKDREENYLEGFGDEFSFYPINLLYLASSLMAKGRTVKVIDPTAYGLNLVDILCDVIRYKPKLVGITCMTASIQSAVKIAKALKKYGCTVVLGGIHVSNDPDIIRRFPYFDYGIVGDGEIVINEIFEGKRDPGLIFAEPIMDLDSLPFPRRDLVDIRKYKRPEQINGEAFFIDILTSRGCPYSCSFCSIYNSGKKVRFRSAKNIVDEMEETYHLCDGNFTINDDCFTLKKAHVLALRDEIKRRNLKISFMCSTRANCIDDEVMYALKEMGCNNACIGVETGSERIRNEIIGKKITDAQIFNAVRLCRKYKIQSSLFVMVGFPTETREDLDLTSRIGPKVRADYIGVHQTTPYPTSRIWKAAIQDGQVPPDLIDKWASGQLGRDFKKAWVFYVPAGFTQQDMIDYKRKIYLRFYFDPKWMIRKMWGWILHPKKFIREDLKLFKLLPQVIRFGGTKGQFS